MAPPRWPKSPETYVGMQKAENFASPGGATKNSSQTYRLPLVSIWMNGLSLAIGQWGEKPHCWTVAAAGSRTAFTRVICTWSWHYPHESRPCGFGCPSMKGLLVKLTESMLTRTLTERCVSNGCISLSDNRSRQGGRSQPGGGCDDYWQRAERQAQALNWEQPTRDRIRSTVTRWDADQPEPPAASPR